MRSGTTLMGNLLHGGGLKHRHPKLAFAPDSLTTLREITSLSSKKCAQSKPLMNPDVSTEFMNEWRKNFRDTVDEFIEQILMVAPVGTPEVFGVKATCLLPELLALSSVEGVSAKFIIMHRDPRDIFLSSAKRYGDDERRHHLAFMNASFSIDYKTNHIPNSLHISYEDLVSNPTNVIQSVLDFIDLDSNEYDFSCIENDLINNSSFLDIGPDDVVKGSGIAPLRVVNHKELLGDFYSNAISELMGGVIPNVKQSRPSLQTRINLYRDFLPQVYSSADQLDYGLQGLRTMANGSMGNTIRTIIRFSKIKGALLSRR
jgi:Sulfotransferase family